MNTLLGLLSNEEKLLERVEELYEDDVELKSRNDPTISRSVCAKQFWSAVRRVLPEATVKKLSSTMNQRRYMREKCLREALALLQENEDVLWEKTSPDVEESNEVQTIHRKSPRGKKDITHQAADTPLEEGISVPTILRKRKQRVTSQWEEPSALDEEVVRRTKPNRSHPLRKTEKARRKVPDVSFSSYRIDKHYQQKPDEMSRQVASAAPVEEPIATACNISNTLERHVEVIPQLPLAIALSDATEPLHEQQGTEPDAMVSKISPERELHAPPVALAVAPLEKEIDSKLPGTTEMHRTMNDTCRQALAMELVENSSYATKQRIKPNQNVSTTGQKEVSVHHETALPISEPPTTNFTEDIESPNRLKSIAAVEEAGALRVEEDVNVPDVGPSQASPSGQEAQPLLKSVAPPPEMQITERAGIPPQEYNDIYSGSIFANLKLDVLGVFPDSEDFSHQVGLLYSKYVTSGNLAAISFWRYLKSVFPGANIGSLQVQRTLQRRCAERRSITECHIANCAAQLPSKLLGSIQNLVNISDSKELESIVDEIYDEWCLLPQKCSTRTFWAILKCHLPAERIRKLQSRLQRRKQNDKRKQLRAQGLHRDGIVRQYKHRLKRLKFSVDPNAQEVASIQVSKGTLS